MTDQAKQLELWNEEHERLRRWYVRQAAAMRRKLGRIMRGERVYRERTEKRPPSLL